MTTQRPDSGSSKKPPAKRVAKTAKKAKSKTAKKKTAKAAPGAAKKKAKKTTAKKTTAKKKTSKKAAAKKTTKKVVKKAAKKKTTTKKVPAKAAAKKAPKKRVIRRGLPPIVELEEYPTEELWIYYRRAAAKKEENLSYLEDLRNLLIERHYPLVRYIAERLLKTLPKSIELDDLISAGLFGLMDAIRGFDASRGIKFKTYCSTRIRGSILDQLRSQDWVPRLVRLKAGKIERALQRLTGEYGREPTHAELARNLDMEHDDLVKEIQDARAKTMFSLSDKWEDDDGSVEKVEILEDRAAIDPVRELNRNDLMRYMTRSLTHKERFIIEQYYQYGHTMREIGEMLALTESRVCQIHSNVMGRLKSLLQQREDSLTT